MNKNLAHGKRPKEGVLQVLAGSCMVLHGLASRPAHQLWPAMKAFWAGHKVGMRDVDMACPKLSQMHTCCFVLRMHVQDPIGVHVKADVDLGDPTRRGGDPAELKLAQQVVVACAAALALVDLDQHARLIV